MTMRNRRAWKRALPALAAVLLCSCANRGGERLQGHAAADSAEDDTHVHHEIDYVEFRATDMDRSKRVYEAAFDWKFNDYGPGYAGIGKQRGGEAGGLRLQPETATGGPLVILYSNDLEATIAKVRAAGGRITQEPFAFPGGRRFHFTDPSGTELAVWSDK